MEEPEPILKPLHRDDIPPELLEHLEQFAAENFPGFKVVFAGDQPVGSLPAEMQEAIKELEERHLRSIGEGRCIDCGAQMEDYNPEDLNWQMPEGWRFFTRGEGEEAVPIAFQCPACDQKSEG